MPEPVIALAMVGRSQVSCEVMVQWIAALRRVWWPGPTFIEPEIYRAGAWIGVVPLRNLATYHMLRSPEPWDWVLWIDADHRVHHHLFGRVQQHARAGLELVCGPYFSRSYPFEVQAFSEATEGGVKYVPPEVIVPAFHEMREGRHPGPVLDYGKLQWIEHEGENAGAPLVAIAGGGTGCMLIRRTVLERMAALRGQGNVWRVDRLPWEEQMKLLEQGEMISGIMTEDIMFCEDAHNLLGVQPWLDLDVRMETGHMGEQPVDRRQYLAAHQVVIPPGVDPASVLPKGYEYATPDGRRYRPIPVDPAGRPLPLNTTRERERRMRRGH